MLNIEYKLREYFEDVLSNNLTKPLPVLLKSLIIFYVHYNDSHLNKRALLIVLNLETVRKIVLNVTFLWKKLVDSYGLISALKIAGEDKSKPTMSK